MTGTNRIRWQDETPPSGGREIETLTALREATRQAREGKRTVPDLIREFIAAKRLPYRLTRIREEGSDGA